MLSTRGFISQCDGSCTDPKFAAEDAAGFREVMQEAKAMGAEVRMFGHSAVLFDPQTKHVFDPPFVFTCDRCGESARKAIAEVFGELPPLPMAQLCDAVPGADLDAAMRQSMTSLRAAGGRVVFYGSLAEFSRGDRIYAAKQFRCSHCFELCRKITEEVFGGAN